MATLATNGSSRMSPAERVAILAALEEYANALAIYHSTLKKPAGRDNDIPVDCVYSEADDLEISDVQLGPDDIAGIERTKAAFTELYEDSKVLVESLIAHEKEETSLLAESDKLEEVGAQLEKMFNDEKIAIEEKKKRVLNELAEEQRDIEKLKLIADAEFEYVTAWETARYEQNVLRGEMEIEKLERILNDWRVREKNEERVHDELTKFLTRETAVSTRNKYAVSANANPR
ncbi:uncharacterized protein LOC128889043 [Hylaeus anthracinus]|uniref:uncharacterized protein LOC128889043 n=1 Tax=Hylaeus anthracinus TaxID=313031 RepID=UPI0023B9BF30|nr:uncharacterized protein LOC128889043 [Hylaeus anthracinus]